MPSLGLRLRDGGLGAGGGWQGSRFSRSKAQGDPYQQATNTAGGRVAQVWDGRTNIEMKWVSSYPTSNSYNSQISETGRMPSALPPDIFGMHVYESRAAWSGMACGARREQVGRGGRRGVLDSPGARKRNPRANVGRPSTAPRSLARRLFPTACCDLRLKTNLRCIV